MTKDELIARNRDICAHHVDGHTVTECARHFNLRKGRVLQILKAAGAWRPRVKSGRDKFLGISISEATKDALKRKAGDTSVSKFVSDALDELVK